MSCYACIINWYIGKMSATDFWYVTILILPFLQPIGTNFELLLIGRLSRLIAI